MQIEEEISQEHKRIAGTLKRGVSYPVMTGKVVAGSVDEGANTCTVQLTCDADGVPTDGVLLNVVTDNGNGMILYPTDGSDVIVGALDDSTDHHLLWASTLVKLSVKVGSSTVVVVDGEITFNGGGLDGLVKVKDLVTKLNNLENMLNDLITKYNGHTHITSCGAGAGTAAVTTAVEAGSLVTTVQSDIENTNIKQG